MTTSKPTAAPNPYEVFFQAKGGAHRLDHAWARVSAVLATGPHTVDELIEETGIHRRAVKGLVYYGGKAGAVRAVTVRREGETAPNVSIVRTVRAYRLP